MAERYEPKVGDVVRLAGGGKPMLTVESLVGQIAGVTWFDCESHLHRASIPVEALRPVRRGEATGGGA